MIEITLNNITTDLLQALPEILTKELQKKDIERMLNRSTVYPIWWDGKFAGSWKLS